MELRINRTDYQIEADADTPLLWVIRDELGLTGTKYGCGIAQCGVCAVLVDGVAVRSCVTPVEQVAGKEITTIEAIEADSVGKQVVDAWVRHQVPQCGYCQSGQVVTATALFKQTARPSEDEITAAMVNLCRCGTYNAIKAAVHDVAGAKAASANATQDKAPAATNALKVGAIAVTGVALIAASVADDAEGLLE